MMNRKIISSLFCFALICATGCNRENGKSEILVDTSKSSKTYTESELNELIIPGMSIEEVTNKFGAPGSAVKVGSEAFLLTYMFPFETSQEQGPHVTGFSIQVKEGRVMRWSPVTGMTGQTIKAGGSQGSLGEQAFQIFIANGSLTNAVAIVDSEGSADSSNFKTPPDFAFKAKMFAGSSSESDEQTVILVLSENDMLGLKSLSEENFGKRLLIVCGNKAIAAPTISAPLASRKLTLTVKNSSIIEGLGNK